MPLYSPMLRGKLFEEVVLALVLKPMHQVQQDGVIINVLFMTIIESCAVGLLYEKPDEFEPFRF